MKKRIMVLPIAVVMVVMVASPAFARGGADVCVSQGGQTVYDTGASNCFSDATSQAVAINRSFANASESSQAVAIEAFADASESSQAVAIEAFAGANIDSQAVAINRSFAGAQNNSQAVAINKSAALALNACAVAALNGEVERCR